MGADPLEYGLSPKRTSTSRLRGSGEAIPPVLSLCYKRRAKRLHFGLMVVR
jgi:hypothetical protein